MRRQARSRSFVLVAALWAVFALAVILGSAAGEAQAGGCLWSAVSDSLQGLVAGLPVA